MNPAQELNQGAVAMGIALDAHQQSQMLEYLALIRKWNRVYNLTAIRDEEKLVTYHLLDSLSVLNCLRTDTLVDVGTGPGLPGIPLAIAAPSLRVTLLESNHKKGTFLRQAKLELKLDNVEIAIERAETYQPTVKFGSAVSRAFSDLATFVHATASLIRPDGYMLAMKGVYPNEELEQLPSGVEVLEVTRLSVPSLAAERHLVVMRRAASGDRES